MGSSTTIVISRLVIGESMVIGRLVIGDLLGDW
jgi:hypothetical protein